jgi:drug/metabolite transporter (DMT)-like permease
MNKTGQQFSLRIAIEAAVALFFFGCIAVVVKFVSANAITIGIARLAITLSIMLPFLLTTRRLKGISLADMRPLALMGIFFALHWLTFFFGIKIGSASIASVGLSTYGVHLIILGWFFHRNKVTGVDLLVLMLAVAGNILVVPEFSLRNREVMGLGLGVLSGFFYAFLPILHQKYSHLPAFTRALGQFAFAFVVFLMFWPLSNWNLSTRDWSGLLFLAIMCTLVSHTIWVRVTTTLSTRTTSVIYYLYVPVSLILSVVALDERVDVPIIAGAVLIILANVLGVFHHVKRGGVNA